MTPLQTRLHTEVCLPAGLTACLCGEYARVAEAEFKELAVEHVTLRRRARTFFSRAGIPSNPAWSPDDFLSAFSRIELQLDADREREKEAKEAVRKADILLANWHRIIYEGRPHDIRLETCEKELRAALSAGAGEK